MRFQCQPGCIKCCEQKGRVYVTDADIERLAAHLCTDVSSFRKRFVCGEGAEQKLRKPRGKQCYFLEAHGCTVHASKPLQCRAFPFWPELLNNKSELQEARSYCPGLSKGPLVVIGMARQIADEVKAAFPDQYADT